MIEILKNTHHFHILNILYRILDHKIYLIKSSHYYNH